MGHIGKGVSWLILQIEMRHLGVWGTWMIWYMGNGHNFFNTAWILTKILLNIDIDVFCLNKCYFPMKAWIKVIIDGFKGKHMFWLALKHGPKHVLTYTLANISVISWSFFKIFLLKIGLISIYKTPPCLLSNLIRALRN